jgi:hypothetical protein
MKYYDSMGFESENGIWVRRVDVAVLEAENKRISELKKALRDLLAEVEQVVSSRSIPPTWLDEEQPDSAIVNARILVEQK